MCKSTFSTKYLRRTKLRVTAIEDKVVVDAHTLRARAKKENMLVRLSVKELHNVVVCIKDRLYIMH